MAIDERKLKEDFVFSGQGTASELTADLDQVAALDEKIKQRIRLIRWSALVVFVGMAILAVTAWPAFWALAVVLPVGILIYSAVAANRPVLQDRVSFLRLILRTLGQDTGQKGRLKVMMRLRSTREKLTEGVNPAKPSQKQKLFRDTWLTLDGRLSDGTSIHESCIDLIRQRLKKNARGTVKTKERRICLLRVQLDYNSETYGDATVIAGRLATPFLLPGGAAIKVSSFTPKALAMKAIVKGDVTPTNLLKVSEALLLGAYRILNLARRSLAATGAPR